MDKKHVFIDWYEVDPIEYYGELFLNSKFMDLLNE